MGKESLLREFIRENEFQLYHFCYLVLLGSPATEKIVIATFREFGDLFRRVLGKGEKSQEQSVWRVALFRMAWRRIRRTSFQGAWLWPAGRDTRLLKTMEHDVIADVEKLKEPTERARVLFERLTQVDLDLRAVLVLCDILDLDDEEVARILELRWGIYRHRIHRARLAYKESLRGRALTFTLPQNLVSFPVWRSPKHR